MKSTIYNEKITFISDSYNVEPWILKFKDESVNYFWRPNNIEKLGAAICFPVLGTLPDNTYMLDDKEYMMDMHGFAKDSNFEIADKTKNSITYELAENKKTWVQYPYKFRLQVVYALEDTTLKTEYRVKNHDTTNMYFSVGGHPRYSCPIGDDGNQLSFEDYYIEFEKPESIKNIVKSYGPIDIIDKFLSSDGRRLRLNYAMFVEGCFCFHPINSDYVTLKSDKSSRSLRLCVDTVTHFQLWAAEDGKFICLEPWYGSITSIPSKSIESFWKERPGTLCVAPGDEFVCAYSATISK